MKTRGKVKKKQTLEVESTILSIAIKFEKRKKIKKLFKNKRNQKYNLAMNFLMTNFTKINLNI